MVTVPLSSKSVNYIFHPSVQSAADVILEHSPEQYRDVAKAVFRRMNVEYAAVTRRFSAHGHFRNWDHGRGPNRKPFALLCARFV